MRVILFGLVVLAAGGGLLTSVVLARVRARAQADWFVGKNLTLAPVVRGLKEPTFVAGPPDGSNRLFVLERAGRVRVADASGQLRPTPFLDVSANTSTGTEEGMLGLAFDPGFTQNGYVYVDYTANDASVQVVRYTVSAGQPDQVDPATAQTVLAIPKHSKYHNGGMLAFGPDGYLYISVGDDESSEQAQILTSLYGKILRIDVDSAQPYAVPASNPFVNQPGARGEIWSYGFRNPWRFSFDRMTGDMWIGDVGDAKWEEVDFQPASSPGGENYGWPMNEGTECIDADHCHDPGLVAPLVTYGHDMNCAVMGGYMYRGPTAAGLAADYLFGDLCTGGVFSLRGGFEQGWKRVELGFQPIKISSFGEDPAGDVYVVDMQGGVIYRIMDGSIPSGS
ncbi:MAG TPA: PQQ-dependent sugar dehydrogenase [Chloroflexota bacterium]|nr:PQQ-dependent sugar dehydrogenase [Chloroflexota bacterium]